MLETGLASSKLVKYCTEPSISSFVSPISSIHTKSINKQVQTPKKGKVLCCSSQTHLQEPATSKRCWINNIYKLILLMEGITAQRFKW